jgi:vanillate O-demethylase ferredoxin subunit
VSFDLRAPDGGALPPFMAGAHVNLRLDGVERSYSLTNSPEETHRYVIAVRREEGGRGGSRLVHERLRPGTVVQVSAPANLFGLDEAAAEHILIAGGIGITPILSMARRLATLGRSWRVYYGVRFIEDAAFADDLRSLAGTEAGRVTIQPRASGRLDIAAIVAAAPPAAHLYCCGPAGMLEAFRAAAEGRDPATVHFEYFQSAQEAAKGGFTVYLARSKKTFDIGDNQSILGAVLASGMKVAHSCQQGVCGACETRVLEGTPDHRDSVLSPREQAANRTMMICCSGSKTPRLVLDL